MDGLIERARRFSRVYTRAVGVLGEAYLSDTLSLAEGRVLYEIVNGREPTATQVGAELGMDPGYLSRILKRLESAGLVDRRRSLDDRRQSRLTLTEAGRRAFADLDHGARTAMTRLLDPLAPDERVRLGQAMSEIEGLLSRDLSGAPVTLRQPQPGDLGWVVERHAVLYAREQGWLNMEGLTARIVADFADRRDEAHERCWIAERDGQRLGCVFLVKDGETTARLRLLLLEPAARGLGLGRLLVEETLRFARQAGYTEMVLWTHAQLVAARAIYADMGFIKTAEWTHSDFGPEVVSETWRLAL
jgi:DNA-binding MarR family transcriptional regulator/GNAT superfamily N-acetyltransferase